MFYFYWETDDTIKRQTVSAMLMIVALGCVAAHADRLAAELHAAGVLSAGGAVAVVKSRLAATRDIVTGEVLLELQRALVLSKDSAQDTALLTYLDPEDGQLPPGLPHCARSEIRPLSLPPSRQAHPPLASDLVSEGWTWEFLV